MAGTLDASRMRKIADNIAKTLGVEDDEGVLTDKFLDALAHAEERGSTHPVRADPRFPNVSQSLHCWTAVNEYQYCVKASSYDNPKCMQRRRDFVELCPGEWVENWQDQIDEDKFMGIGDTLGPPEEEEEEEEEEAEEEAAAEEEADEEE